MLKSSCTPTDLDLSARLNWSYAKKTSMANVWLELDYSITPETSCYCFEYDSKAAEKSGRGVCISGRGRSFSKEERQI